ncbi:coiled-coil domain-containing protein 30 isoform X3 [Perca flavescens]|uniref:coiled-coil domain-containing protein 30 isoform X3 n=1 Tax=Perca flavescens TaxID=8167 RepID=UPI00106EA1D7|nr:coiled-coil domain-containing protein 30-like isoform X3 [Perca flavescens]
MDQPEEEPEQIATWFSEQGLPVDSPVEAKLRLLWSALQRTRSCLSSVTWELDTQRSQHLAEMAEVRKSLEQIRIFTEHKDVLAQEIQDENDQLKEQLRRLISLQDAQINEVAKMLYQQGLTELIHSSPSEQVAYLLVERASLLEMSEDPNNLTGDGNTVSLLGSEAQALNTSAHQSSHKGAPRHSQSPWKRLFGLHKASQSKHTFVPAEPRHLAGQASSMERECSRLERDLEEASRRLAMAHNEIRRLTDELESAHLTQKDYDVVELRKAKELNDCLDLEIRALRSRVRTLDAEKSSLQQTVASLQREVERLQSVLQEQQQQLLTVQVQAKQANELAKIRSDTSHNDLDYPIATTCSKENNLQDQKLWKQNEADLENCENTHCHLREHKELQTELLLLQNKENTLRKECPHCQEAVMTLLTTQEECKTLKDEICEALKCLDKERSKYHEMKEKHKAKLCRAKQKCDDETTWRDKKIKTLERELSFCSHSVAKEKELTISITAENEKLLVERRRLLQQLNEEEHNKNDSNLTASLSQCRVDFLEMENKKLGNKILHMSKQLAVLERGLQNMQSLHFAEVPGPTSSVMMPESSDIQGLLDNTPSKQTAVTYYPHCLISGPLSRSAEMGYLNLTSAPGRSDHSTPLAALSSS